MIMRMSAWITLLIGVAIFIGIGFSNSQCIQHEKEALLELKSGLIDDHNMLGSWDSKADCCSWSRVICDNFTGHVLQLHLQGNVDSNGFQVLKGNISTSLLELKHLKYLDLGTNDFSSSIPEFFGSVSSLRVLDLSEANFVGKIPSSIGNLTSLVTLDLSENSFVGKIPHELGNLSNLHYLSIDSSDAYVDRLDWVATLSSLKFLEFGNVNLSTASDWVESLGKLPSLEWLHLSFCQLKFARIPPFSNLSFPSLSALDLSENEFYSSIPDDWFNGFTQLELLDISSSKLEGRIPSSIGNLTSLKTIDLCDNYFVGQIPTSFGNLTSLNYLCLYHNNLVGQIPTSFKSLCNLRSLDLSFNPLSQEINRLLEILSYCASDKLEFLSLLNCSFSGHLSDVFNKFKRLAFLDISLNSIVGPLPLSIGEMVSLKVLRLSFNKLDGSLPLSFGRLENLTELHLSYNSLEGEVSEIHFKNLHNLDVFYASENHLIWKVNPEWVPPFQLLNALDLRSSEVGPQFPTWLRHLKYLRSLDLSNSNIYGQLPTWFLNTSSSLSEVNLSHNHMHGIIPNLPIVLEFIDLSSNCFDGSLPYIHSYPSWIDFSHNLLSGSIQNFLCNVGNPIQISRQVALILKGNNLNGEIPVNCLIDWAYLDVLDLSNNNLSGNIPTSIGSLQDLKMLSLRNNHLTGDIPYSLQNCTHLVALDLGENELRGEIASWIGGHFRYLKILDIGGNKFHGPITKELCNLTNLQILEFANNNLNGTIPTCIGNLIGMSTPSFNETIVIYTEFFYMDTYALIRKGQMVEYNNTLGFVQSLDLSNNNFVGEIPEGITNLSGLQSLNLSHNFFKGKIPKEINGLQNLESLDLSHNCLFGEIPQSMSSMNFLSDLNLSHNNLSGKIPIGTQLQSMDPSSFTGNKLCGPPLTKDCCNIEATPPSNAEGREDRGDETRLVDWFYFYVSLALGFVVGFWCFVGPLAFNIRWRHAYFNFLDLLWDKTWVWYRVNIVRFVRNYGL